jgi:hypothetical protein
MTNAQIREYAKDELGIELPAKASKAELITSIKEISGQTNEPTGAESANEGNEDKRPTAVIINIPENEDDQVNYVRVNENGRTYQIMKGQDVRVPYGVYDNLRCAIEAKPVKTKTAEGKEKIVMKERPRFAFSVVKNIYGD